MSDDPKTIHDKDNALTIADADISSQRVKQIIGAYLLPASLHREFTLATRNREDCQ